MGQNEPNIIQKIFGKQTRRVVYNCNAALIIVAVLFLAVIINLLATRFSFQIDSTKNKAYSLSGLSIQALKDLRNQKKDLMVYGFFDPNSQYKPQIEDLLKEYHKHSSNFQYEFIDPNRKPTLAKEHQIQEIDTLVFAISGKEIKVLAREMFNQTSYNAPPTFNGEQVLTNTIYKMISVETKKLYLLQGHGERDYQQAKNYITGEGYELATLNLMKDGKIPADCSMIIIVGPQTDLLPQETTVLNEYMAKGGRIMLLLDYIPETTRKSQIPNLVSFIQQWGIDVEDSMVLELQRHSLFDNSSIIPNYQNHPITQKLQENNINVLLPADRALKTVYNYKGSGHPVVILESSDQSWAENNLREKNLRQDLGETKGPIPLGMVSTITNKDNTESRLIVLGTSSFLSDDVVTQAGNLNLFYNMAQWLLGQEDRISITPKQVDITRVTLTPVQASLISWSVLIIIPLILLVLGGVIWFRRRAR